MTEKILLSKSGIIRALSDDQRCDTSRHDNTMAEGLIIFTGRFTFGETQFQNLYGALSLTKFAIPF